MQPSGDKVLVDSKPETLGCFEYPSAGYPSTGNY